jgi:enoyl-CoA hydratase
MASYTEVLFDELPGNNGNLGVITLNRPEVLNALNQSMVKAIHAQLQQWKDAKQIKAVVIRAAEGRAFCAGGDLRDMYDRVKEHNLSASSFFHDEYQLNQYIFHFPKPYIAFLDGITMGGGVGLSIHGSHRIVTQQTLFAMPETGIGFYPDVGGTYFLTKIPCKIGYYLGLTGTRILSDDCVSLGVAQAKILRETFPALLAELQNATFSQDPSQSVTEIINEFAIPIVDSPFIEQGKEIETCFSSSTIEEVMAVVGRSQSDLCQKAASLFANKSPTSLKVTLQALQKSEKLSFDACMQQEYQMTCRFLKEHDFAEGIRAVIIDKDQKPQWQPSSLESVTPQMVNAYFK